MRDLKKLGWVRLHRKIENNFLWFLEPFTKAQAWIDLFLNANHQDSKIDVRGNIIEIKKGQIGWSELTMCKRWKWSKGKVRRFLKLLETEQQIIQQKDRYITTIITIINYDDYQKDIKTVQQTVQQKDSRQYIDNNDKNEKNVKKEGFRPPSLDEVKTYCEERKNKVSAENFVDFYSSKGWLVGKTKMKDWRASVRTWENRDNSNKSVQDEVYIPNYAKSWIKKDVDKK